MIRKAIILLLVVILVLFLLFVGGSFYLLGTDTGFRWTAKKLESAIPGLSVGDTTGNLESGINSGNISWKSEGTSIDVTGLTSTWSSGCLFNYTYCLDKLNIKKLVVLSRPISAKVTPKKSGPLQLPQINLPLEIDANEVTIDKLVIDTVPGSPPIEIENVQLKARAAASSVDIDWLTASYQNYSLQLQGDVDLSGDYSMQGNVTLTAKELIDGKDLVSSLSFSNTLRDLAINGYVAGAIRGKISGTVNPLAPKLPLNLKVEWDNNGWPLDTQSIVKSSDASLLLNGTLDDYQIDLTTALSGKDIPDANINIRGGVNSQRTLLHTINLFTLDGFATGSAAISWADNLLWTTEIIAKRINPGAKWPEMKGQLNGLVKANGRASDGNWSLNLTNGQVSGTLREFPLTLDAQLKKNMDDQWQIEKLDLENGPNTVSVTGIYGESMDLSSTIDFPAIHYLIPELIGDITATSRITGTLSEPGVELDARSSILKAKDVLLRDVKLNARAARAALEDSSLEFTINTVNSNAQRFDNFNLNINGTREAHKIDASVKGPTNTSVLINAAGSLEDSHDWQGQINNARVSVPAHNLKLQNPTRLSWDHKAGKAGVDPHCWMHRAASLCLNNKVLATSQGRAEITLKDYSLEYLNALLPDATQLDGDLTADAEVRWGDGDAYNTALTAGIRDGLIIVADESQRKYEFAYEEVDLRVQADPYTINSELQIRSRDLGTGQVSFTLNPKNENKNILGEVSLQGFDIGFLQAFMPEIEKISGTLNVDGEVSGSLSDPAFNGQINLDKPVLHSFLLPLTIDGGKITAMVDGNRADLDGSLVSKNEKLANSDIKNGIITLGGNLRWPANVLEANITVDGDTLVIKQNPVTRAVINPAMRLTYKNNKLQINGDIDIPTASINIKELPEGTTSLSGDVVIIEEQTASAAGRTESALALIVDVNVKLGEDVNLTGYGLDAELTGDFNVNKTGASPPQLLGEVRVVEGVYKSYGQDLSVEDGQILFVGPIEQTTLNIDATRTISSEERVAGLRLSGPIAEPEVTLFTEPADKTQESILSYIVLGRDLGATSSSSESTLLATAALALTIKQGKGVATGFAESLGISDFTVETDGSGDDTQLFLSGRLSSKLLLRYGRSVFVPEQTLFIRYDISRKLYLEAAQGVERAVDIFYSFSF